MSEIATPFTIVSPLTRKRQLHFEAFCKEHFVTLADVYQSMDSFFHRQFSLNDWILFAYEHTDLDE